MDVPSKPPQFNIDKSYKVLIHLKEKGINEFIKECNSRYYHWDELKYKNIPPQITKEELWAFIKLFRLQQYKNVKICDLTINYVLSDQIQLELHKLDKNAAGNIKSDLDLINSEGKDKYIISSLMEEAIASSQLEGAATTRKVAKEILRTNKKPKNTSEQMIVNGYLTMQKVLKMTSQKLTPQMILDIQKSITEDTFESKIDEGRYRDNNEVVVGDPVLREKIYHIPPDYRKIPRLIEELCNFANNEDEQFIHPIIKGIMIHFLIGYIHPFNDGNGRTARTLFYWYVLKKGYWLFEFMAISRILLRSKKNYGMAYLYTETDEMDLTYFVNYNLKAIAEALDDMEKYISRKQREQAEAMKIVRANPQLNSRQADILKNFIRHSDKNFFISEILSTYGVVYETARSDLYLLEKLGHISKYNIKRKLYFRLRNKS